MKRVKAPRRDVRHSELPAAHIRLDLRRHTAPSTIRCLHQAIDGSSIAAMRFNHWLERAELTTDFEAQLKEWCATASGPYRRPFAPNPQWATAQVVIVGANPATPLRMEFASFE